MRKNNLRSVLSSGKPTLGTRLNLVSPNVVELLGSTGLFDYVEYLAEYNSFDLVDLENFCRAAELSNLGTLIKIDADPRAFLAQRGIGAGFEGVLFADCRSAEDARSCVQIIRPETPEDGGIHGAANRRFAYSSSIGNAEYVQFLREAVVVVMIEKKSAVEHLDEILAVPGIDLIQWGPADYSMSVGKPGQRRAPEIREVEKRVFEAAARAGIPARAEIHSPDDAKYYLDMGVKHFSLTTDFAILLNGWRSGGEQMRKLIAS